MDFPDDSHRHAIFGMTGTGKTVFGLWCLSQRSYDKIPWIILDFKRDPVIRRLPQVTDFPWRLGKTARSPMCPNTMRTDVW